MWSSIFNYNTIRLLMRNNIVNTFITYLLHYMRQEEKFVKENVVVWKQLKKKLVGSKFTNSACAHVLLVSCTCFIGKHKSIVFIWRIFTEQWSIYYRIQRRDLWKICWCHKSQWLHVTDDDTKYDHNMLYFVSVAKSLSPDQGWWFNNPCSCLISRVNGRSGLTH